MGISHSWNGTVLTITSDSGTSSADLKGDIGIRGPQGPQGPKGEIDTNLVYTIKNPPSAEVVGAVPVSRTINQKALDSDIVLTAADVGARPSDWMPTAADVGAREADWMPTAAEIGAREINWTPTAAEVGAAPAGYGLGSYGEFVDDLNNATKSGFYSWTNTAANIPFEYGALLVLNRSGGRITQIGFNLLVSAPGGIATRYYTSNVQWTEWEWLNPPMAAGVEYRTTERHKGKAVYTKLVELGALPNNTSKNVDIGVNEERIVRAEIMIGNGTNLMHLPYFLADGTLVAKHLFNATNVQITTTRDYSGYNGHVQIWYTKN